MIDSCANISSLKSGNTFYVPLVAWYKEQRRTSRTFPRLTYFITKFLITLDCISKRSSFAMENLRNNSSFTIVSSSFSVVWSIEPKARKKWCSAHQHVSKHFRWMKPRGKLSFILYLDEESSSKTPTQRVHRRLSQQLNHITYSLYYSYYFLLLIVCKETFYVFVFSSIFCASKKIFFSVLFNSHNNTPTIFVTFSS